MASSASSTTPATSEAYLSQPLAVPHYVAAVPNPKAALALLRRLEGLVGVAFEASGLEEESESFEQQVSNAVSANPEIQDLVQRLEQQQAEQIELGEDLPSGEALGATSSSSCASAAGTAAGALGSYRSDPRGLGRAGRRLRRSSASSASRRV
jgi:hypothetical protein